MLFNSSTFALFLPVVFALYWGVCRSLRARNVLLIAAGFFFYGWWDWRFLLLLIATSMTDYLVARAMGRTENQRRRELLLGISVVGNLGTLGVFKYYDFFARSFEALMARIGVHSDPVLLRVVLPVGISFYTFQALSYTIDVYRRRIPPERDVTSFMAFISFFPQLCAGPIERASHMLPQFSKQRVFSVEAATDGLRQMLWGFFKKIVVADNCAMIVDDIFKRSDHLPGAVLCLGAVLFAFQIYCDFGGYSDIALGCARLFGFELMRNFNYPYFSRDIAEFWRRWHISLSSWFRDYVYIPLGGSRGHRALQVRNILIVFAVSGFWHGANWTFIAWGLLNAVYFLPLLLRARNRDHLGPIAPGRLLPSAADALRMAFTFALACFGWIFFRAKDIGQALRYITRILTTTLKPVSLAHAGDYFPHQLFYLPALCSLILMLCTEWSHRDRQHALQDLRLARPLRWSVYLALVLLIVFVGQHHEQRFIYFQF